MKIVGSLTEEDFRTTRDRTRSLPHSIARMYIEPVNLLFIEMLKDLSGLIFSFSWTLAIFNKLMAQSMYLPRRWCFKSHFAGDS